MMCEEEGEGGMFGIGLRLGLTHKVQYIEQVVTRLCYYYEC